MHSPIIYIVQKESDLFESLDFKLDYDLLPCEEDIDDSLVESDWNTINTMNDRFWHRGEWPLDLIFDNSRYANVEKNEKTYKLKYNFNSLKQWDEDLMLNLEKYIQTNKEVLAKDEIFYPFAHLDITDYFAIKDQIGSASGNMAYVLYKEYDGNLELYGIYKEKDIIDHCKQIMRHKDIKEVEFEVCLNVVGDYHY
jgi:hypothetical protein